MYLADQRITLQARPSEQQSAVFEVVMLGHCGGKAELSQLSDNAIAEISSTGLVKEASRLSEIKKMQATTHTRLKHSLKNAADENLRLNCLYNIPVPILSLADFQALFPQSSKWTTGYKSYLAGNEYWLPKAVADFFNHNEALPTGAKKLWIIRVNEADGQQGFLPGSSCDMTDVSCLTGMHLALILSGAALITMPDLERLQIPQQLPDKPRIRLQNPAPAFLPCSQKQPADDGHRERRNSHEMSQFKGVWFNNAGSNKTGSSVTEPGEVWPSEPWSTSKIVANIIQPLHKYRPDMQCLWSLGLEYDNSRGTPGLSTAALDDLKALRKNASYSHGLHRIQFIFPYLRLDEKIYSAVGLLSGLIASQSIQQGTWRSVAGVALADVSLPYPVIDQRIAAQLRESHGLGLLVRKAGRTCLDDERLASPYTPKYGQASVDGSAQRSGELVRFMGFLQRKLLRLGESILFSMDPLDPRPMLLLEQFFDRLHDQGALRGGIAREAYNIEQIPTAENVLKYEIQIAPAFSIDHIRLSFSHQHGENTLSIEWEAI